MEKNVNLKDKINKRIKEHEDIMQMMEKDMNIMLTKLNELKGNKDNHKELMTVSTTLLTLKDKMMFHKAAIITLKDVLTDI